HPAARPARPLPGPVRPAGGRAGDDDDAALPDRGRDRPPEAPDGQPGVAVGAPPVLRGLRPAVPPRPARGLGLGRPGGGGAHRGDRGPAGPADAGARRVGAASGLTNGGRSARGAATTASLPPDPPARRAGQRSATVSQPESPAAANRAGSPNTLFHTPRKQRS